jgi:hypothetical protein
MKKVMLGLLLAVAGFCVCCSKPNAGISFGSQDADEFTLNQPFTLNYGSDAHLAGNPGFRIEFKDIIRDNRCANEAICTWEGRVDAGINLSLDENRRHDTLSKAGLGASTATDSVFFQHYKVKLLGVDPYPSLSAGVVPVENYKLRVVVTSK